MYLRSLPWSGWLRCGFALNRNRTPLLLLLRDRDFDFKQSVLELRASVLHVRSFRQRNASIEESVLTLCSPQSSFFLLLLDFALSLNHERIIGYFDLYIIG